MILTMTYLISSIYILSCFSLLPHIVHPTRVSVTTATLIDNIFCDSADYNIYIYIYIYTMSGNIISTISDHFPQFFILNNFTRYSPLQNKSAIRNWNKFNKETFLAD